MAEQWLRTVLAELYKKSTTTRAEILTRTGLNPASASHAFQHLIHYGVVLKIGELHSRAGRRRELLRLNPEAAYVVAVDLEASPIRFALTNLVGDIRCRWEEEVDSRRMLDIGRIANGVEMVSRTLSGTERERVLAVGISRPGVADGDGLVTAVNLGWKDFPLEKNLASVLTLPFFVENSARTFVLAERWHGRAQNRDNCVYIEVGKGVGAGVVVDGQFFAGHTQMEFGHITVDPAATDLCKCGKRGCLEAITSSASLMRQYAEQQGGDAGSWASVGEIIERARQGEAAATAVVDRAARTLGLAMSHLVALFNPELLILGGYVVSAEDVFVPRIREEMERHVRPWMGKYELSVSGLGVDIGLKGAASRAFYGVLNDSGLLKQLCYLEQARHAPKRRSVRARGRKAS